MKLERIYAGVIFLFVSMATQADVTHETDLFDYDANDFSVRFVEDKDFVSVIEFSGNYDRDTSDGTGNAGARAEVAKEFYQHHADEYDFLMIFTQFDIEMGENVGGFHMAVKRDVEGIGTELFDNTGLYGSAGKLQATIDLGNVATRSESTNPLRESYDQLMGIMMHELMHQWTSFVKFIDPQTGEVSSALLGANEAHWSPLMYTGSSIMYGADWRDNGNGTFTAVSERKFYSPLDLYLAGINSKEEVPPFFIIENASPAIDPESVSVIGQTISGTRKDITIDDIIAHEGPRIPAKAEAQKDFRIGVILLTRPGVTADTHTIGRIQHIRRNFMDRFSIATGGRARVHAYPEALPENGIGSAELLAGSGDRAVDYSLDDGISWLRANQEPDASWMDKPSTQLRDTAFVLEVLSRNDSTFTANHKQLVREWLLEQTATNNDSRARLLANNIDISNLSSLLLENQNADGGWGLEKGYASNPLDTALVLQHFSAMAGQAKGKARNYLYASQNNDGGWGNVAGGSSSLDSTAQVLIALTAINASGTEVNDGFAFLQENQDANFGFGDLTVGGEGSNVGDTALALIAHYEAGRLDEIPASDIANFITSRQMSDGDWNGSVYTTALAVRALKGITFGNWKATALAGSKNTIRDGERLKLNASIVNDGGSVTDFGSVRFYLGDPQNGGLELGDVPLPLMGSGQSFVASFYWDSFGYTGEQTFYAVVDPEQTVLERLESDNSVSTTVTIQPAPAGVELEIVESDISVIPPQLSRLPASLAISANVRNFGLTDASNVNVQIWQGLATDPETTLIDTQLVNVSNRSNALVNFVHELTEPGTTYFRVVVDPTNVFIEENENNNSAYTSVSTIDAIDLEVDVADISVDGSVMSGQDLTFTVVLKNSGTIDSPSAKIRYSIEGESSREIQLDNIAIAAGQSITREITWRVDEVGDLSLLVEMDVDAAITEVNEANNSALYSFGTEELEGINLTLSHADISFNPEPALEGYGLFIDVAVLNAGTEDANGVTVDVYNGDPMSGGELIGSDLIAVAANQYANAQVIWPIVETTGTKLIYVVLDQNNNIEEIFEDDNNAFKQIAVTPLPDLALGTSDIQFSPAAPVVGMNFQVVATISNLGSQQADFFDVSLYLGDPQLDGQLIETQRISELPGNTQQDVVFSYLSDQASTLNFFLEVDSGNEIPESSELNNLASKLLLVQNANFNVSSNYISPNGDGIQDEAILSYAFEEEKDLVLTVVNKYGHIVQTFSGDEFNSVLSGQITWNGRNSRGSRVHDGVYQLNLSSADGNFINSTTVHVDTNRSSLRRAILNDDLVERNLSCHVPSADGLDGYYPPRSPFLTGFSADGKYGYFRSASFEYENPLYGAEESFHQVELQTGAVKEIYRNSEELTRQEWLDNNGFSIEDPGYFYGHYGDISIAYGEVINHVTGVSTEASASGGGYRHSGVVFGLDDKTVFQLPIYYEATELHSVVEGYSDTLIFNSAYPGWSVSRNGRSILLYANKDAPTPVDDDINFGEEDDYLASNNMGAFILDTTTLSTVEVALPEINSQADILNSSWSDDGRYLAVYMQDKSIKVFDWKGNLVQHLALQTPQTNYELLDEAPWWPGEQEYFTNRNEIQFAFSGDNSFLAYESCVSLEAPIPIESLVQSFQPYGDFDSYCGIYNTNLLTGEQVEIDGHLTAVKSYASYCDDCGGIPIVWEDLDADLFSAKPIALRWLPGEYSLVYNPEDNDYRKNYLKDVFSSDSGRKLFGEVDEYLIAGNFFWERNYGLTPNKEFLFARRSSPEHCDSDSSADTYLFGSLDNLTVNLRALVSDEQGGIVLSGSAADINFKSWVLEYSLDGASNWQPITSSSPVPVNNERFTTWVPDSVGVYYVRLTASDLAGNTRRVIRPVSWGSETSISSLQLSNNIFSPNEDGALDAVSLSFNVLQPVHLLMEVFDVNGTLVRSFEEDFSNVGAQESMVWDGRNDLGQQVPDGEYLIRIGDYEFTVYIDTQAPLASAEVVDLLSRGDDDTAYRFRRFNLITFDEQTITGAAHFIKVVAQDDSDFSVEIQSRELGESEWQYKDTVLIGEASEAGLEGIGTSSIPVDRVGLDEYRLLATDLAGNTTIQILDNKLINKLVLFGVNGAGAIAQRVGKVESYTSLPQTVLSSPFGAIELNAVETIVSDLVSVSVQYKLPEAAGWTETELQTNFDTSSVEQDLDLDWDPTGLDSNSEYHVRLKLVNSLGSEFYSNKARLKFITEGGVTVVVRKSIFPVVHRTEAKILQGEHAISEAIRVFVGPLPEDIVSARLYLKNPQDLQYENWEIRETLYEGQTGFGLNAGEYPSEHAYNFEFNADNLLKCSSYQAYLEYETSSGDIKPDEPVEVTVTTPCLQTYYFLEPQVPETCGVEAPQKMNVHLWPLSLEQEATQLQSLSIEVAQEEGEPNLVLFNQNIPESGEHYLFEFDTSTYDEGQVDVIARLVDINGLEQTRDFSIAIDHTAPEVDLIQPMESQQMCGREFLYTNEGSEEIFYAADVQASIQDNLHMLALDEMSNLPISEFTRGGVTSLKVESSARIELANRFSEEAFNTFIGLVEDAYIEDGLQVSVSYQIDGSSESLFDLFDDSYPEGNWAAASFTSNVSGNKLLQGSLGPVGKNYSGNNIRVNLEVRDFGGYRECIARDFILDANPVEGFSAKSVSESGSGRPNASAGNPHGAVFSPNDDGKLDSIKLEMLVAENASVSIGIYPYDATSASTLLEDLEASGFSDPDYQLLTENFNVFTGENTYIWDGKIGGQAIDDGDYVFIVRAVDGCGLEKIETKLSDLFFSVDTEAPQAEIVYPNSGDPLAMTVPVHAIIADRHITDYHLSYIAAGDTNDPLVLETGQGQRYQFDEQGNALPVDDQLIYQWNTASLLGPYFLNLTASDPAGNVTSYTSNLTFADRTLLMNNLSANDYLSVNGDGNNERLRIRMNIIQDSFVSIDIVNSSDLLVKSLVANQLTESGELVSYWDGLNSLSMLSEDGDYKVRVSLVHATVPMITQSDEYVFILDSSSPEVVYENINNGFVHSSGEIIGSIFDQNMESYALSIQNNETGNRNSLQTGSNNVSSERLALLDFDQLSDGGYTLHFEALDKAGNSSYETSEVFIDTLKPQLSLEKPFANALVGSENKVSVIGSIVEENLDTFSLSVFPEDDASSPVVIEEGNELPETDLLSEWDASQLADGTYTLRFFAVDLSGREAKIDRKVIVDNTAPVIAISEPINNQTFTEPFSVVGSINDDNFVQYTLSLTNLDSGESNEDFYLSNQKVSNGTIFHFASLPEDGSYLLEITARDRAELSTTVSLNFGIDTIAPLAPENLDVQIENEANEANWDANSEEDLAGYNLYRNGMKLNSELLLSNAYSFTSNAEGEFSFVVTAVDQSGLESEPSLEKVIFVDQSAPAVSITSPYQDELLNGLVDIFASVSVDRDDLDEYRVFVSEDLPAPQWQLLNRGSLVVSNENVAQWNSFGLDGAYLIKIEAEDSAGNSSSQQISVSVDNTPPATPTGLVAIPEPLNESNIQLSWDENTESDLAGYLLLRNGSLVNAPETLSGDLSAFAIDEAAYQDVGINDGEYSYTLMAVDEAGNISAQSEPVSLLIDERNPVIAFASPVDGSNFDAQVLVSVISDDADIDFVSLSYRELGSSTWIPLTNLTASPFDYIWNTASLDYGQYEIMAEAIDVYGGQAEAQVLTLTKADFTAPSSVDGLAVLVNGFDLSATWLANNTEADFSHYQLALLSEEGVEISIIDTGLLTHTFTVTELGEYRVSIQAVDSSGNVSTVSEVDAEVFDIQIDKVYPVTLEPEFSVSGTTQANASVSMNVFIPPSESVLYETYADTSGHFEFNDFPLAYGVNLVSFVSENDGNFSVPASVDVFKADTPATPTGLEGVVSDPIHHITMSWDLDNDPYLGGYYLFDEESLLISDFEVIPEFYSPDFEFIEASSENAYEEGFSPEKALSAFDPDFDFDACDDDPDCFIDDHVSYFQSSDELWTWKRTTKFERIFDSIRVSWLDYDSVPEHYKVYTYQDGTRVDLFDSFDYPLSPENDFYLFPVKEQFIDEIYIEVLELQYPGQVVKLVELATTIVAPQTNTNAVYELADSSGTANFKLISSNVFGYRSEAVTAAIEYGEPPAELVVNNLTANVNHTDIEINWNGAVGSAGYVVYWEDEFLHAVQANCFGPPNPACIENEQSYSFVHAGLSNGDYQYSVIPVDGAFEEAQASYTDLLTINIPVPDAPENLVASGDNIAEHITLNWQQNPGAHSYVIYRSTESASGFDRLQSISENSYIDVNAESGETYFYYVLAVDEFGNESDASNLASATYTDVTPPTAPEILIPVDTVSSPFETAENVSDIGGVVEEESEIFLFQNGLLVAQTESGTSGGGLDFSSISSINFDQDTAYLQNLDVLVSPDGDWLLPVNARHDSGVSMAELQVVNARTGVEAFTISNGFGSGPEKINSYLKTAFWTGNNELIVVEEEVDPFYNDIHTLKTVDPDNGVVETVATIDYYNQGYDEFYLSDNQYDVENNLYIYSVELYDDVSSSYVTRLDAIDLNTGTLIENWGELPVIYDFDISPDGRWAFYTNFNFVILGDLSTGNAVPLMGFELDGFPYYPEISWHQNSSEFAYINEESYQIEIFSVNSQNSVTVYEPNPNSIVALGQPIWGSEDNLLFTEITFVNGDLVYQILEYKNGVLSSLRSETSNDFFETKYDLAGWNSDNLIAFKFADNPSSTEMLVEFIPLRDGEIEFLFENINLVEGSNIFTVQALDGAGNASQHSEQIDVNLLESPKPDLTISLDASPVVPIKNSPAIVNLHVANIGQAISAESDIELLAIAPSGSIETLYAGFIDPLFMPESRSFELEWVPEEQGQYTLLARIDHLGLITETSESNNSFESLINVADEFELALDLNLSKSELITGEELTLEYGLLNGNFNAVDGLLLLNAYDEQGYLVEEVETYPVNELRYGEELSKSVQWLVPEIYPGAYYFELEYVDDANAETLKSTADFVVLDERILELTATTSQSDFTAYQDVDLNVSISNLSASSLLESGYVSVIIESESHMEVYSNNLSFGQLLPDNSVNLNAIWNTAQHSPGVYTYIVELFNDSGEFEQSISSSFELVPGTPILLSELVLNDNVISGSNLSIPYSVRNDSNFDLSGLNISLSLISASSGEVFELQTHELDLEKNQSLSFSYELSTGELQLGDFKVALEAEGFFNTLNYAELLQEKEFTLLDGTPPVVFIDSPVANDWINTDREGVVISASDLLSPVSKVELRIDGGDSIFVENTGAEYLFSLSGLSEGFHQLQTRAYDASGNKSNYIGHGFYVDNTPPEISVEGVESASYYDVASLSPEFLANDANLDLVSATLNSSSFVSGDDISEEGQYILKVEAIDHAQNKTSSSLFFAIDRTDPEISISQVISINEEINEVVESELLDGSYNHSITPSVGIVDTSLDNELTTITLNGLPFENGSELNADGDYVLLVNAVDKVGRSANKTVNFTIDTVAPDAPEIISPLANETITHTDVVTLLGSTEPNVTVVVENNEGTSIQVTADANGSFEYQNTYADGAYTLNVRAIDLAGNEGPSSSVSFSVQRDVTAPEIVITGVEQDAYYNVPVAPVIQVSDDTALDSSDIRLNGEEFISGTVLSESGSYQLDVEAIDTAGNESSASLSFVIDTDAPVITLLGVSDGDLLNSAVTPVFSASDSHLDAVEATLNGESFASNTAVTVDGTYTLVIAANDLAGNESTQSVSFELDQTAPEAPVIISPNEGAEILGTQVVSITGSAEANSQLLVSEGASVWSVNVDSNGAFSFTNTFADGTHSLSFTSTDAAGNVSLASVLNFRVQLDITAPEIVINGVEDGVFYNNDVTPIVSVIDDIELGSSQITLNGAAFASGSTISGEGAYNLSVTASDAQGNESNETLTFTIDKTEPVITINGVDDGELVNTDVIPQITVSDANISYQLVSLNGIPFDSGAVISDEGAYQLMVSAYDLAGNESAEMLIFTIDKTPPVLPTFTEPQNGETILGTQVVSLSGVAEESSVVTLFDGTRTWVLETDEGLFSLEQTFPDGNYEVFATSMDEAGNTSAATSVTFSVQQDIEAPIIAISGVADGEITNNDVVPHVEVTDDFALASVQITLNGSAWLSGDLISDEGNYLLEVVALDNTGNQSQSSVTFSIDKTAPHITFNGISDGGLYAHVVTPSISITDINTVNTQLTLNGAVFANNTTITEDGVYQLSVVSTDIANNQSTSVVSFEIDQTAPIVPTLFTPSQFEVLDIEHVNFAGDAESNTVIELLLIGPDGERTFTTTSDNIGLFEFNSITVETGDYMAVVVAIDDAGNVSGELQRDFSVDLQSVEIAHTLSPSSETLVWIPRSTRSSDEHNNIVRWMEFLDLAFEGNEYTVVRNETDFISRLRTQRYQTIVLIGLTHVWGHPLIVSLDTQLEIRARVAAGDGFLWVNTEGQLFDQWWDMVGAKSFGPIYGVDYIEIESNSATSDYYIDDNHTHATRLLTFGGQGLGNIVKCWWRWCSSKGRALVLNEYGEGKTAVLGINPALASDEYESLLFFRELLEYVVPPESGTVSTASAYQLKWQLSGVDNKDLLVEQVNDLELAFLNVEAGEQLDDERAQWQWSNSGVSEIDFASTILIPESPGSYTVVLSVQEIGSGTVLAESSITIESDSFATYEKEQQFVDALRQYNPEFIEYFHWNLAIRKAEYAVTMPRETLEQKEAALGKLLDAVFWTTLLYDDERLLKKAGELVKAYEAEISVGQ